jgi:hypothetical protein
MTATYNVGTHLVPTNNLFFFSVCLLRFEALTEVTVELLTSGLLHCAM